MATNLSFVIKNKQAGSAAAALGISVRREEQLDELMNRCYAATDTYIGALAMASRELQKPEELAYLGLCLGIIAERVEDALSSIKTLIEVEA